MKPLADFIWMNGALTPWGEAKVHVLTHALHYGTSVFEGIRAYDTPDGPCVFRLADHVARLFDSARIYGVELPFTREAVEISSPATTGGPHSNSCPPCTIIAKLSSISGSKIGGPTDGALYTTANIGGATTSA